MMGDRQERNGALRGIRTPDLLVRSQLLYPAELGAHAFIEDNNAEWVRQFQHSRSPRRVDMSVAIDVVCGLRPDSGGKADAIEQLGPKRGYFSRSHGGS